MMRLLLDTHTLLWWLDGSNRLGRTVRSLIAETPELAAGQVAFPYDTAMFAYRKTH